jgi:RimJ/RimL family protein N-acetyltransferase
MKLITERLILLRDKEYFKGRWWDTLLFAILDYEWREQQ